MKLPEIEITVRFKGAKKSELRRIQSSADVAQVCRELMNADTIEWVETALLICLNTANKVVGWYKLSQGGINATVMDPRIVMTVALQCCATNIVLCHNHPSRNPQPSRADQEITEKIRQAARTLDIKLLDHVILTDEGYFSFTDEGLI